MNKKRIIKLSLVPLTGLFLQLLSFNSLSAEQNPVSSYLYKGNNVPGWTLSIGNGLGWFVPVKDQKAKTKRKNLTVKPVDKDGENDALNITWKGKKVKGQWGGNMLHDSSFTISRNNIDISSIKDAAALVLDMKILRKPNEATTISMSCKNNNKCAGKYPLKAVLRRLPTDEWFTLPIPLACFKNTESGELDFSKVTTAMSIATQGKLEIELANVALAALPPGKTGCN